MSNVSPEGSGSTSLTPEEVEAFLEARRQEAEDDRVASGARPAPEEPVKQKAKKKTPKKRTAQRRRPSGGHRRTGHDFTGSGEPGGWRLSAKERAAGAIGISATRAILESKDPVKVQEKEAKFRAKILQDLDVEIIDNRHFDLTLGSYSGDPVIAEQAEQMEEWLFDRFALKDRFDEQPDGLAQREQYYTDFIEEGGELAENAWEQVFLGNKLDLGNVKKLLGMAQRIDVTLARTLQPHRRVGYRKDILSILQMLHPQEEKYDPLPYREKVEVIRLIEDLTVDYLWSLHYGTDAASYSEGKLHPGQGSQQGLAGDSMLEPDTRRDAYSSFKDAARAAKLRTLRHGQDYLVRREGELFRVVADPAPIVTRKLT